MIKFDRNKRVIKKTKRQIEAELEGLPVLQGLKVSQLPTKEVKDITETARDILSEGDDLYSVKSTAFRLKDYDHNILTTLGKALKNSGSEVNVIDNKLEVDCAKLAEHVGSTDGSIKVGTSGTDPNCKMDLISADYLGVFSTVGDLKKYVEDKGITPVDNKSWAFVSDAKIDGIVDSAMPAVVMYMSSHSEKWHMGTFAGNPILYTLNEEGTLPLKAQKIKGFKKTKNMTIDSQGVLTVEGGAVTGEAIEDAVSHDSPILPYVVQTEGIDKGKAKLNIDQENAGDQLASVLAEGSHPVFYTQKSEGESDVQVNVTNDKVTGKRRIGFRIKPEKIKVSAENVESVLDPTGTVKATLTGPTGDKRLKLDAAGSGDEYFVGFFDSISDLNAAAAGMTLIPERHYAYIFTATGSTTGATKSVPQLWRYANKTGQAAGWVQDSPKGLLVATAGGQSNKTIDSITVKSQGRTQVTGRTLEIANPELMIQTDTLENLQTNYPAASHRGVMALLTAFRFDGSTVDLTTLLLSDGVKWNLISFKTPSNSSWTEADQWGGGLLNDISLSNPKFIRKSGASSSTGDYTKHIETRTNHRWVAPTKVDGMFDPAELDATDTDGFIFRTLVSEPETDTTATTPSAAAIWVQTAIGLKTGKQWVRNKIKGTTTRTQWKAVGSGGGATDISIIEVETKELLDSQYPCSAYSGRVAIVAKDTFPVAGFDGGEIVAEGMYICQRDTWTRISYRVPNGATTVRGNAWSGDLLADIAVANPKFITAYSGDSTSGKYKVGYELATGYVFIKGSDNTTEFANPNVGNDDDGYVLHTMVSIKGTDGDASQPMSGAVWVQILYGLRSGKTWQRNKLKDIEARGEWKELSTVGGELEFLDGSGTSVGKSNKLKADKGIVFAKQNDEVTISSQISAYDTNGTTLIGSSNIIKEGDGVTFAMNNGKLEIGVDEVELLQSELVELLEEVDESDVTAANAKVGNKVSVTLKSDKLADKLVNTSGDQVLKSGKGIEIKPETVDGKKKVTIGTNGAVLGEKISVEGLITETAWAGGDSQQLTINSTPGYDELTKFIEAGKGVTFEKGSSISATDPKERKKLKINATASGAGEIKGKIGTSGTSSPIDTVTVGDGLTGDISNKELIIKYVGGGVTPVVSPITVQGWDMSGTGTDPNKVVTNVTNMTFDKSLTVEGDDGVVVLKHRHEGALLGVFQSWNDMMTAAKLHKGSWAKGKVVGYIDKHYHGRSKVMGYTKYVWKSIIVEPTDDQIGSTSNWDMSFVPVLGYSTTQVGVGTSYGSWTPTTPTGYAAADYRGQMVYYRSSNSAGDNGTFYQSNGLSWEKVVTDGKGTILVADKDSTSPVEPFEARSIAFDGKGGTTVKMTKEGSGSIANIEIKSRIGVTLEGPDHNSGQTVSYGSAEKMRFHNATIHRDPNDTDGFVDVYASGMKVAKPNTVDWTKVPTADIFEFEDPSVDVTYDTVSVGTEDYRRAKITLPKVAPAEVSAQDIYRNINNTDGSVNAMIVNSKVQFDLNRDKYIDKMQPWIDDASDVRGIVTGANNTKKIKYSLKKDKLAQLLYTTTEEATILKAGTGITLSKNNDQITINSTGSAGSTLKVKGVDADGQPKEVSNVAEIDWSASKALITDAGNNVAITPRLQGGIKVGDQAVDLQPFKAVEIHGDSKSMLQTSDGGKLVIDSVRPILPVADANALEAVKDVPHENRIALTKDNDTLHFLKKNEDNTHVWESFAFAGMDHMVQSLDHRFPQQLEAATRPYNETAGKCLGYTTVKEEAGSETGDKLGLPIPQKVVLKNIYVAAADGSDDSDTWIQEAYGLDTGHEFTRYRKDEGSTKTWSPWKTKAVIDEGCHTVMVMDNDYSLEDLHKQGDAATSAEYQYVVPYLIHQDPMANIIMVEDKAPLSAPSKKCNGRFKVRRSGLYDLHVISQGTWEKAPEQAGDLPTDIAQVKIIAEIESITGPTTAKTVKVVHSSTDVWDNTTKGFRPVKLKLERVQLNVGETYQLKVLPDKDTENMREALKYDPLKNYLAIDPHASQTRTAERTIDSMYRTHSGLSFQTGHNIRIQAPTSGTIPRVFGEKYLTEFKTTASKLINKLKGK